MPFNKFPSVQVNHSSPCLTGWQDVLGKIEESVNVNHNVVIECYQGVYIEDLVKKVADHFGEKVNVVTSDSCMKSEEDIISLTFPYVTDDRIFGYMSKLSLQEFFDVEKLARTRHKISISSKPSIIIGTGAALIPELPYTLFYVDMARWEIQQRMRRKEVSNIGLSNKLDGFETHYKRGYFLDWRLCDELKKDLVKKWDYVLDTNNHEIPKLITGEQFETALDQVVSQPFSVVPFFDPGPWGGQWMRDQFDLDKEPDNFAWCFNCVPEENSLLLNFNGTTFETPSINVVLFRTKQLLGEKIQKTFGAEFPIRFDFLDTIDGGNLSLQVHPLTNYIKKHFGMTYTQDESYYMLDAQDGAQVYLGLRDNVDGEAMITDLKKAQSNGHVFDADIYAQKWPAKKHDHFLIPAGTVHCSGTGCMVLEISATPYIFTFKLWDWGRLGMDGKPRPINIEHGEKVIQWDRQPEWTDKNLINRIETVAEGDGWREERTGLHELEFIETRRHWQTKKVEHHTNNSVDVLMVVEGEQALVESPTSAFEPFVANYAEAFIIPANIDTYTITPYGLSEGKEIATIKAFVRT